MTMNKKAKPLYGENDFIGRTLSEIRNKKVLPLISGRLIDIACGDNRLVREYGSGQGVDIFDFGSGALILPDFKSLPFADGVFDTATIIASLNYFADPVTTLREVHRILTPEGQLILTMPNSLIMKIWHKFREPNARHFGYTGEMMRKLLDNSGFYIEKKIPFMFGLNFIYIAKKK